MTKKTLSLSLIATILIIVPLIVGAEIGKPTNKGEPKAERQASGTPNLNREIQGLQNKNIISNLNYTERQLAKNIKQIRNIISRMTGEKSIIAKLDEKNVNTTAIKEKLNQALALVTKAETELNALKASTTLNASSTPEQITVARKAIVSIKTQLNQAVGLIKQARKLIGQIPTLGKIIRGDQATTTASSTTN